MDETFWKSRREELGLSQFEMAVRVGKTPSAVAAWDSGRSKPKLSDREVLSTAYEVTEKRIVQELVAATAGAGGGK